MACVDVKSAVVFEGTPQRTDILVFVARSLVVHGPGAVEAIVSILL